MVLISKPPILFHHTSTDGSYDALGYSLVMSACLMSALGIVLTKLISRQVEKLVILFYLGVAAAVCGGVGLFMFGSPSIPDTRDWILAIAIALLGMIQQYILVWAVQVISQIEDSKTFDLSLIMKIIYFLVGVTCKSHSGETVSNSSCLFSSGTVYCVQGIKKNPL